MATLTTHDYWRSDTPVAWTRAMAAPPALPADAAESGYYIVATGTDPDVNLYGSADSLATIYRGDGYVGYAHPPNPLGGTGEDGEGPWELPDGDLYLYSWGATYSPTDPEPTLPDPPIPLAITAWFTPPPTFSSSHWHDRASLAPPVFASSAHGIAWSSVIETSGGDAGTSTYLEASNDGTAVEYHVGQTLITIPVQTAWDVNYSYGFHVITGVLENYSVPPDPAAPSPLPAGTILFNDSATPPELTTPRVIGLRITPVTLRADYTAGVFNYQGVQSLTVFELPTTSPYHPNNFSGGFLGFVPRSVLLTMTPLWSGVPVNGVTTVDLTLSLPADEYDTTSVLVVPTAMLSTTPPASSAGDHWAELMGTTPEALIEFQGAEYLVLLAPVLTVPWLRQLQRDDDVRQFPRNGPTSLQASARQGPRGTYL